MITFQDTFIASDDNLQLFLRCWNPESSPIAVVHILHGLAEHCLRYAPMAEFFNQHRIAVVAHDQRGHGKTADGATLGLFSKSQGWQKVVTDVTRVQRFIAHTYPNIPVVLLGHSMGSYVAQAYIIGPYSEREIQSHTLCACILSGSNRGTAALFRLLRTIVWFERWRQGYNGHSKLVNFLSFNAFNNAFKPNRTKFDWLSRDKQQVDLYINDARCGQLSSNQLWLDLLAGLIDITRTTNLARIPPALPFNIIGGGEDPVSAGNGLALLADALKKAGVADVDLHIYPNSRHEIFNEINRRQVFADVLHWIQDKM